MASLQGRMPGQTLPTLAVGRGTRGNVCLILSSGGGRAMVDSETSGDHMLLFGYATLCGATRPLSETKNW